MGRHEEEDQGQAGIHAEVPLQPWQHGAALGHRPDHPPESHRVSAALLPPESGSGRG